MKPRFITPIPDRISTVEEAKEFLDQLVKNREYFDLDDDLENIVHKQTNEPIFSLAERFRLEAVISQMNDLPGFDAKGYMLTQARTRRECLTFYLPEGSEKQQETPHEIKFQYLFTMIPEERIILN